MFYNDLERAYLFDVIGLAQVKSKVVYLLQFSGDIIILWVCI